MVDKIYRGATYILSFSIAFPQKVSSLALLLWLIAFVVYKFNVRNGDVVISLKGKLASVVAVAYTALMLFTMVYSEDSFLVLDQVFVNSLPFLILPLCSLFGFGEIRFENVLRVFILGSFFSMIFMFLFFGWQYFVVGNVSMHRSLIEEQTYIFSFFTHRTYFGVNIALALFGIIHLYRKGLIGRGERALYVCFILLSFFFVVINNSRIITLVIILNILLFVLLLFKNSIKASLSIFAVGLGVMALFFIIPSRFSHTMDELRENKFDDPRLMIWDSAKKLVAEHPVVGFGCANWSDELVEQYKKDGHELCYFYQYGIHNQYIGSWLDAGLPGLALCLFLLLSLAIPSERNRDKRFFAIMSMILFSLVFMVEEAIGRYHGALSLGFALLLLDLHCIKDKDKNTTVSNNAVGYVYVVFTIVAVAIYILCFFDYRSNETPYYVLNRAEEKNSAIKRLPVDCKDATVTEIVDRNQKRKFFHDGASYFYEMAAYYRTTDKDKQRKFSVDCFVSSDFNGEWVRVSTEPSNRRDSALKLASCYYNMEDKGKWQNLEIELPVGNQIVFLYTKVDSCFFLDKIQGCAIFVNPKFTEE